jgi:hypothetical protein
MTTREGIEEGGGGGVNEIIMVIIWITMAEDKYKRYMKK